MPIEKVLILRAAVLRATIAVMDEPRRRAASSQGVAQRLESQRMADSVGGGPTHDATGEDVDDDGEEDPALACADLGDVSNPKSIGSLSGEVSLHEVGSRREIATRRGDTPETLSSLGAQALQAHQPRHTVLSGSHARNPQSSVYTWRAVDPSVLTMNQVDALYECVVLLPTRAGRASKPGVKAAAGDLQDAAKLAYREGLPLLFDEAELHFCSSAK